jgi:hypothetical protein
MRITAALVANSAALQGVHHRGARSARSGLPTIHENNGAHWMSIAATILPQRFCRNVTRRRMYITADAGLCWLKN